MNMCYVIVTLCAFFYICECVVFTRCKLAEALLKTRAIKRTHLGHWVCLVESVSSRNTRAYLVSASGTESYGLFQIGDRWCREGKPGGECNVRCESLLDDDIKDDTNCAMTIFNREGFKYWPLWDSRCKNNISPITKEIYACPELQVFTDYSKQRLRNGVTN